MRELTRFELFNVLRHTPKKKSREMNEAAANPWFKNEHVCSIVLISVCLLLMGIRVTIYLKKELRLRGYKSKEDSFFGDMSRRLSLRHAQMIGAMNALIFF